MEIYGKTGTPGKPHKLLAKLEGSWTTGSRGWTEPGKPLTLITRFGDRRPLLHLPVSEAIHQVIVHHSCRLHEGINLKRAVGTRKKRITADNGG